MAGSQARRWPWLLRAFGTAGLGLALTALLLARRPSAFGQPTIWAEDGTVFGQGALEGASPLMPYAGQLWPLERVIASAVTLAPVRLWPVLFYVVACLVVALPMTVLVQRRAAGLLGALGWRVMAAVVLVAVPGAFEVQGNLTNIHWWWCVVLWVLLALPRPTSRVGRVCELAGVAVLSLTGPLALFALPVVAWRLAVDRSRYSWLRAAIVAVGALMVVVLATSSGRAGAGLALGSVPEVLLRRWAALGLGENLSSQVGSAVLVAVGAAMAAIVVALVVLDLRGPSWAWLAAGLGAALSGIALGVADLGLEQFLAPFSQGRYAASLLLASLLIIMRGLAVGVGATRLLAAAALAACAVGIVGDARLRPAGPGIPAAQMAQFQRCVDELRGATGAAGGGAGAGAGADKGTGAGGGPGAGADNGTGAGGAAGASGATAPAATGAAADPLTGATCSMSIAPQGWTWVTFRPGYEDLRDAIQQNMRQ